MGHYSERHVGAHLPVQPPDRWRSQVLGDGALTVCSGMAVNYAVGASSTGQVGAGEVGG